ncbi:hypothetical protein [Stutzerimonas nosocomialis]|uniref:hypothetical protein n=1 Tax=Stutzerimonas nosocomialis TaxID=1056496 RepID=UPI0011097447|nr:hypothetical protein [Stutzerimonas nosocomialis]
MATADLAETEAAILWFDGAVKVNKGEGVFSTFIRGVKSEKGTDLFVRQKINPSPFPDQVIL